MSALLKIAAVLAALLLGFGSALAQPAPFNYPAAGGGGSNSCSGDINAACSQVLGVGNVTTGVLPATHGGTGQGGAAAARGSAGLDIDELTGHGDSAYTILSTDRVVATNAAFTAARVWTLPAASAVNAGQRITIIDGQGTVTNANTLTVSRAGTDTIENGTVVTVGAAYGGVTLISDGVSKWAMPHTAFGTGTNPTHFDANGTLFFHNGTSSINDAGILNISGPGNIDLGNGGNHDWKLNGQHVEFKSTGGSPTLSACGTSPSITGVDAVGRVTVGTAPSTTCTLTFATAWTNAPICFGQDETTALTMRVSSVSTTAVTFTASGAMTVADKISYRCDGYF